MYLQSVKTVIFIILVNLFTAKLALGIESSHQHASAIGIHGMAVFKVNNEFYASHMPLANSIHAHQVIFSFQLPVKHQARLDALLAKNGLVTIVPETFDLYQLAKRSKTQFSANIVNGHFERGGQTVATNVTFSVKRIVLFKTLSSHPNGQYYLVSLNYKQALLVHRIADKPSYDQIILVNTTQSKLYQQSKTKHQVRLITVGNSQALENNTNDKKMLKELEIDFVKLLYLEHQDFM